MAIFTTTTRNKRILLVSSEGNFQIRFNQIIWHDEPEQQILFFSDIPRTMSIEKQHQLMALPLPSFSKFTGWLAKHRWAMQTLNAHWKCKKKVILKILINFLRNIKHIKWFRAIPSACESWPRKKTKQKSRFHSWNHENSTFTPWSDWKAWSIKLKTRRRMKDFLVKKSDKFTK